MDKETKLFFERLSGIKSGDDKFASRAVAAKDEGSDSLVEEEVSDNFWGDLGTEAEGQLTVDVYQTPNSFVIKSAVAGVEPENLDIAITSESVSIRGKRHEDEKIKSEHYLHQECYWGSFSRSIILPQEIDPDKAQASLSKNGILKITLPKVSRIKTKKLKIKFE